MKNHSSKNTKQNDNQKKSSPGQLADFERWWSGLSQGEKEFAFEAGKVMAWFKAGIRENDFSAPDDAKESMCDLVMAFARAYKRGAVEWPARVGLVPLDQSNAFVRN